MGGIGKVIRKHLEGNVVLATSMVAGYGIHVRGKEALELFTKMQRADVPPDNITFVSILFACSHAGLVKEGWYWFNAMSKDFRIDLRAEHYGCMVDLLGRAGCLNEAFNVIKGRKLKVAPVHPTILNFST